MKRQRKIQGVIAKNKNKNKTKKEAHYTDGYIMAHVNQILRNLTA